MTLSQSIREAAAAATPGPWHWTWDGAGQPGRVGKVLPVEPVEVCGYDSHCIALTHEGGGRFDQRANAAFIAQCSPEVIVRLLDVVEAAHSLIDYQRTGEKDGYPEWDKHFDALGDAVRCLAPSPAQEEQP